MPTNKLLAWALGLVVVFAVWDHWRLTQRIADLERNGAGPTLGGLFDRMLSPAAQDGLAGAISKAYVQSARTQLASVAEAIERYRLENKRLPVTLAALTTPAPGPNAQPYLASPPVDPWGNELEFRLTSDSAYSLRSLGPDGRPDTADDLTLPPP